MTFKLRYKTPSLFFKTFKTCGTLKMMASYMPVQVLFEDLLNDEKVITIADNNSTMLVFNSDGYDVIKDTDIEENTIYSISYSEYVGGYIIYDVPKSISISREKDIVNKISVPKTKVENEVVKK